MIFSLHEGEFDREDVRELIAAHFAAMRAISPPEACHVMPIDSLRDPAISFWSARENGALLGIGALKALAPNHGEVKSMRTAPAALGRGVGSAMLAHLTEVARQRGITRLSLETGSSPDFAAALRLYEREGFLPCPPFGDYQDTPFTRFFSREL